MALIPSDPQQQKKLLIGILPILLLFGYWYFMHGARAESIALLETQLADLETKNQAAQAQMRAGGPDLEQRVALYEQYMERLEQLIPEREEVPELLHSMTLQAQQYGVELVLMRPGGDSPEQFYTRQVFDVAVAGLYHDVGAYMSAIGSLPRIVAPINMRVVPRQDAGRGGVGRIEAAFSIETYILPAEGEVLAPAQGGANAPT